MPGERARRERNKDMTQKRDEPEPDSGLLTSGVHQRLVTPIVAFVACALVFLFMLGLSHSIDYHAMVGAMRGTSRASIGIAILFTALSYLALMARDQTILTRVGVKVSSSALALASFCATALGNALGFGKLTGHAVRNRVYSAVGITAEEIALVGLLLELAFAAGVSAFAAGCVALSGPALATLSSLHSRTLHIAGLAALAAIAALFAFATRKRWSLMVGRINLSAPPFSFVALQLLLAALDLGFAAAALWFLLPAHRVDFTSFAAIFSAAIVLGVISRLPGGIGVFEIVMFLALRGFMPPDRLAAALVIYRGVYFLLPLLIAAACLAGLELRRPTADPAGRARERLLLGAGLLAPIFLSVVTFSVGVMLIISGATPAVDWRLAVLQGLLPLWAVESSHLLATLAGVFLLFVARGLYHRLDGAWWLALVLGLINVVFGLAKGLAFGETVAVVFLIFQLLATRRQFTRPAALLRQPFTIGWFLAMATIIVAATGILMFAFRDVAYRHEIWWQFEFDAQASRALRAMLGASILLLAISLWQLLRSAPGRLMAPSAQDLVRAASLIRGQDRSAAMLALMGDKSFLFSDSGNSFLMYARRGRSWVALFDPIGPYGEWPDLVWRFVEMADAHGGRAAFYQIRPEGIPIYLDAGLRVVKIGEEAYLELKDFGLDGSKRYGLRQALKRAEREGLVLEFVGPGRASEMQAALESVSEAWLRGNGERGFSVAAFGQRFIEAQSVVLASQRGRLLAFVTVMTTDLQSEATIGLMRQRPDAPPYTMELVFTQLALYLKERGFDRLSLGMAPLAGLVRTPLSSRWHRAASLLWEHGRAIYNFQGLRAFKNKFRPEWEPRYLATSGAIGPFLSMADVAALASGRSR